MKALALLVLLASTSVAHAYHNGKVYDLAPGAGGGGGLFYTGAKRERQWNCTVCHVEPRNRLNVTVTSEPVELFEQQQFTPNTAYAITIAMAEPMAQLGLSATRSNYNGIAISMFDDAGAPAGMISNFDPGRFYARGTSILASDSTTVNETSWTFTWTAPATATGTVTINLGVVDGNGANSTTQTLTDPFGDDTKVFEFVVRDAAAMRAVVWGTDALSSIARWLHAAMRRCAVGRARP